MDNSAAWTGRTDDRRRRHRAAASRLRNPRQPWKFSFIVTAAKDGDVAYVGSDWNEGIEPYAFGARYDLNEAEPLLRGTVFSDRGVYKLGEEIHFKAILRRDTPAGIQLIPAGTPVYVSVTDSRDKVIDRRTVTTNAWSSLEWTLKLPVDGALGNYQMAATLDKAALDAAAPNRRRTTRTRCRTASGSARCAAAFLVAAYRRPGVPRRRHAGRRRGDAARRRAAQGRGQRALSVRRADGQSPGRVDLFAIRRSCRRRRRVLNRFPADRFAFVGCCDEGVRPESGQLGSKTAALDANGQLTLDLDTQPSDGLPYQYTIEGDVEDRLAPAHRRPR